MNFNLEEAIQVLERTPRTLESFLSGLPCGWVQCNEGDGTWNASEVILHFIECEKSNWIPRLEVILREGEGRAFPAFDRFAHLKGATEQTMEGKLNEFTTLRTLNTNKLREMVPPEANLELTGIHPDFGVVRLRELLAAWVVHDFTHIAQIVRVMAERYRTDVGPWKEYLGVLKRR